MFCIISNANRLIVYKLKTSIVSLKLSNFIVSRRFVFYLAMLVAGAGSAPLYSLGVVYLDENVKQRYSALYNGNPNLSNLISYFKSSCFLKIKILFRCFNYYFVVDLNRVNHRERKK